MRLFFCNRESEVILKASQYLRKWGLENITHSPCPIKEKTDSALNFASIRIIRPESPLLNVNPLSAEIRFEETRLRECRCGKGPVYDGFRYAELVRSHLPKDLDYLAEKPVFVTLDYIATFPEEKRYHLRYAVFTFPVVVSLRGIVEAPARPREYYLAQSWGTSLPEELEKDFLTGLEDARLPRVLAGLLLQAWFYYQEGYPFCSDPNCALFNAHWQKDLLRSQSDEPYTLCKKHKINF